MTEFHESDIPAGKLFDKTLTRRLLYYVRPYVLYMVIGACLIIPLAFLSNFLPLLIKRAVDDYLVVATDPITTSARLHGLIMVGTWYLAICLGASVLRFFQGYLMSWVGQKIIFDMRADIFAKILRLSLSYFDRNPVGRLMTRVSSDVEAMQRFLTDGLVGLTVDVFTLLGILGFMFYLNTRLALILLVLLPVLLFILTFINYRIRGAHRLVRQRQSALNAYLQEMLTGMPTVQLFNREDHVKQRFDQLNTDLRKGFILSIHWFSYFFPAIEILNALSLGLVLLVGGYGFMRGDPAITLGVLIAFVAYVRDFFRPLEDLSDKSNILQSAMASSERVFALMDVPEDILDPTRPLEITSFQGDVDLDHVTFAYKDKDWVLKDVSLKIRSGESVAIVGATGAGKTSITSLVARFYDVQQGSVKVDSIDVRELRQVDLRRRIGVVMQDPFIFSGSIESNISLYNPDLTREKIVEAATYVNAHDFIMARAGGYDAEIMERGAKLSTGQKQLLALARAIAQNPDILLILDEATANVDTETEQLIQDALEKLMKGRTSIIIAHRLSTIRHVDRILVMRQGQIVEEGSHNELLQRDGYYKRLYDLLIHTPTGVV